jgi:hypothetical protein
MTHGAERAVVLAGLKELRMARPCERKKVQG